MEKAAIRREFWARRLAAFWAYYSGETHRQQEARVSNGDLPWRIIRYQRIIDPEDIPYPVPLTTYTRPKTFEMHLRYLGKHCHVIPLEELMSAFERGAPIKPRTVAITIDGGRKDGFYAAFGEARHFSLPLTFFVPTSFIGTNDLPLEEKIAFGFSLLAATEEKLPELVFMKEEEKQDLKSISPNGEISPAAIGFIIQTLMARPIEERLTHYTAFAVHFRKSFQLDFPESFLTWDELLAIQKAGHAIASAGHTEFALTDYPKDEAKLMVTNSFSRLKEASLEASRVFAFPHGVYTKAIREFLHEMELRRCVSNDYHQPPEVKKNQSTLFHRISMFEGATFSTDMFACRLWGTQLRSMVF